MRQGFFITQPDDKRVPVGSAITIGRTGECGLMIDDTAASRKHVEVVNRSGRFIWKDLGSTNGTYLNGNRMLGGELKHGDEMKIGETVLRFEVLEQAPPPSADDSTLIFRETILDSNGQVRTGPSHDKSAQLLAAVYSVTNAIASQYDPCMLIDQVLETTLKAIDAQRGAVFLVEGDTELRACPICNHVHMISDGVLKGVPEGSIDVSRTVTNRVLEHGESVLFQDNESDVDLSGAHSIMSLRLRSIICVPLRAKYGILGVLYIDSDRPDHHYAHEDMLLATAVGSSAGLALENAQMHQHMLEKQRIEHEISTAWSIQQGFLVKDWPEDDIRYEVFGETIPAKTVGGDFFDFVQLNGDTVGMLIGDVSGKGVPAALTMAQLLAEFRLQARDQETPAEVLYALNNALTARSQFGMFCTLSYLTLDLDSGAGLCASAGHHPVLRVGDEGVTFFGGASGPPAGVLAGQVWENESFRIAPGETLLMYTDGIVEARRARSTQETGAAPEEFEEEGLILHAGAGFGAHPRELLEKINNVVIAFCAPDAPHDDRTMIAMRYSGSAG